MLHRRSPNVVDSFEEHSFNACKQFDGKKSSYFVNCEQGQFNSINELTSNAHLVSKEVLRKDFLLKLKEFISKKMQNNIDESRSVEACLKNAKKSKACEELAKNLRAMAREGLPQLRKQMAMMKQLSLPDLLDPSKTPENLKFEKQIKHPFRPMEMEPINSEERAELLLAFDQETNKFTNEWIGKNSQHRCVEKSATGPKIKTDKLCESLIKIHLHNYISQRRVEDRSKVHRSEYDAILEKAPYLALFSKAKLPVNDSDLDQALAKAFQILSSESMAAREKFNKRSLDEIGDVFRYPNLIEEFLNQQNPLDQFYCDIGEELNGKYKENGSRDLIELAGIIGLGIAGTGACALTAGVACAVGVATASNLYIINSDQKKLNTALTLNTTGLVGNQEVREAVNSRNTTIAMAPLAYVGVKAVKGSTAVKAEERIIAAESKEGLKRNLMRYEATNASKNRRWIEMAKAKFADEYFEVENAALKRLNDTLDDKNLVTALTNLHKKILFKKMEELKRKYPGVVFEEYSDFKSSRFAMSFKNGKKPPGLDEDLNKVFQETNQEFSLQLKEVKDFTPPPNEDPAKWFAAGLGKTADEASLASRQARNVSRENLMIRSFDEVKGILEKGRTMAEHTRLTLVDSFKSSGKLEVLMEKTSSGVLIPTQKVFEFMRKANLKDSSADFSKAFEKSFGVKLSDSEVAHLKNYFTEVDKFSPGLWMEERVLANLDEAAEGGFSADFKGMGARNIKQVAEDLASSYKKPLEESVDRIRKGEELVTKEFESAKGSYQNLVAQKLKGLGIDVVNKCSGDDCASIPARALSSEEQRRVVEAIATSTDTPANYRLCFIPPGVEGKLRTQLSVQGELIEKGLRSAVTGFGDHLISPSRLDKVIFAVEMPKDLRTGSAKLVIQSNSKVQLTSKELALIQKEFEVSMKKVRDELLLK